MYHEVIFALNGISGDYFHFDGKCFQMKSKILNLSLLHPSEQSILNGILEIASLYVQLETFQSESISSFAKTGEGPMGKRAALIGGLYMDAFCIGIREILTDYLEVVSEIELMILDDIYLTLQHIRIKLEPFHLLFVTLNSSIVKIKAHNKSSAILIEIVKNDFDGNVHLQDSLQKLLPRMNDMLYKQIRSWVVYGALVDPNQEFFICEKSGNNEKEVVKAKNEYADTRTKYIVDYSLVPNHLSVSLTDRILFAGNSVQILTKSKKTKDSLIEKQKDFYEKIKGLSTGTFRTEDLSDAIDDICTSIGKNLHHLVVTEADLLKHIAIVKDFYLTGRGELFHDFLFNLKQIPKTKLLVLTDIQHAFVLSAARVQVQEDISQRITVSLPPEITRTNLATCISKISLEMKQEWPLHILYTEDSIKEYNELFRFLLQIRLIQLELNTIWANTKKVFRFPIPKGPAELKVIMSYFIDHLQHYLQEDVLESHYTIFKNVIDKSDNFDDIKKAHITFRHNILLQSFRSNPKVKHFVEQILNVCAKYVNFMNAHIESCELENRPVQEGISKEIAEFSTDFQKHMELLLNLLKGLASNPQTGQHLKQFLLRLDYNSYFTTRISGLDLNLPK